MATVVFWGAVLLLLHTYFLYPLVLFVLDGVRQVVWNARYVRRGGERRLADSPYLPVVSLVVAACDGESCVAQKVANSLALDYPARRVEVLIGSDGSTDGTDQLVARCRDSRVRLMAGPRSGKAAVVNRCVAAARGDVVLFSGPGAMLDALAVRKLVRHFVDPEVGAVCGNLRRCDRNGRDEEESAYQAYESLIKLYEGKLGAVMGASGGFYAIRRQLFTELPSSAVSDELLTALRIMENGYRVRFDADAVAREETAGDRAEEMGRRARIAAGNFQALRAVPGLLAPWAGFRAFAFWSHKVLRWCAPALMALAFAANWFLLEAPVYRLALVAQLLFYGLAVVGWARRSRGGLRRVAGVAYDFVNRNAVIAVGFWRFLRGEQRPARERAAARLRTPERERRGVSGARSAPLRPGLWRRQRRAGQ